MAHSQALKSPYESKPALKKLEDNRKHNIIVVVHLMGKEKALFLCVCVCVCVLGYDTQCFSGWANKIYLKAADLRLLYAYFLANINY